MTSALVGGCLRGTIVERKADYIGDLDGMYAALMGTLMHRTLEYAARPGSLAEWRFWTTVDGVEVSCSPDHIDPNVGVLTDWKKTEHPPSYYPWPNHKEQVQLNRFIFNNAERWADPDGNEDAELHVDPRTTRINHVVVTYLGPKGPTVMEIQKSVPWTTPNNKVIKRKVPDVWSDKVVYDFLSPRLEAWSLAMDAFPDWPKGLEEYPGWNGPPEWRCPGAPLCNLPNCVAKRYPNMLTWKSP